MPNSFTINNKINNKVQNYNCNKAQHFISKKLQNSKNKYQSDKKLKQKNSPYYTVHKKTSRDTMSAENQKILLQKRELEIKDLKMKCQKLEQENQKYQLQNILLKNNCIKNKNNIDILPNNNNTSSNFPIRNEIKSLWENFAKIELLNNFIEFENEPEIIYHILCELILLSDKMIKEHCLLKYQEILKIIGVKNNVVMIKDIETQFKNFMKEHLNEIFYYLQDISFINDYKKQLKNIVLNSIKCINQNNMMLLEDVLEQYEFKDMLKNINDIILFTQFNEPTLYFQIEENYEKRKIKYIKLDNENKKEYIVINNQGNLSGSYNSIILLEPPILKSGHIFYPELKPILMLIEKGNEIDNNDNINIEEFQLENNNNRDKKEYLSIEQNKETIEDKIKFNSINNTSRINRNMNINYINKNKKNELNNTNNNNSNNKKYYNIKNRNKKNEYYDINKATIDTELFSEYIQKSKNLITINSSRPFGKRSKKKKFSISKDINFDDPDFCSTDENGIIKNNHIKIRQNIMLNHPLNKKYNKIHRIKSANNYFGKNQKIINNDKNKFIKQNTNIINKKEGYKLYNNYNKYLININNDNNNLNKNLFLISSDTNQSLSNEKNNKKPLTFKKNIINKNINSKDYHSPNNNKENIPKSKSNKKTSINNPNFKNSKANTNIQINNILNKNTILLINQIFNKHISPSKKEKSLNNKEQYTIKNIQKKHKCVKNKVKKKNKNINYSNNNSNNNLFNNVNLNINFSNISTKRAKQNVKRIDSFDQKNSTGYYKLDDIKKMMDNGSYMHKPIIMISTNSNINRTINVNKYHYFNKSNIFKAKNNNFNTINSNIKKLNSLSQTKIIDYENCNYNSNAFKEKRYNKMNAKSLETMNNCCINKNNYLANRGICYKQFSIDETTFNTSSQFNMTHDFNNKSNKKYKKIGKKYKENKTFFKEAKTKNKSSFNSNNININQNKENKNKIKQIEINIEGLSNNNYNTINAQPNKNRYRNYFHYFESNKIN